MTGRTTQREAVAAPARRDSVKEPQKTADREQADAEGIPRSHGVAVERAAVRLRGRAHEVDILGRVAHFDLFTGRGARLDAREVRAQLGGEVEQNLDALRPLGMSAAGIVLLVFGVDNDGRARHCYFLTTPKLPLPT